MGYSELISTVALAVAIGALYLSWWGVQVSKKNSQSQYEKQQCINVLKNIISFMEYVNIYTNKKIDTLRIYKEYSDPFYSMSATKKETQQLKIDESMQCKESRNKVLESLVYLKGNMQLVPNEARQVVEIMEKRLIEFDDNCKNNKFNDGVIFSTTKIFKASIEKNYIEDLYYINDCLYLEHKINQK